MPNSRRVVVMLSLLALAAAGCSGGGHTKAGAKAAGQVTVLQLENANSEPGPLTLYAAEVSRLSGGSLRIYVGVSAHHGDPAAEQAVIADVRAGRNQLAWVGARAWDLVGVDSFQALLAPFLIDSYPLEQQVLQGAIPARMLESLRPLGLVGIGVLPGPIRRMLGVRKPFLKVSDFAGTRIGISGGKVARATMRALGATAVPQPAGVRLLTGLDGFEQQLGSVAGNQYDRVAQGVTTNVSFWPRPLVLFANRKLFSALSASQRAILLRAARDVLPSFTQAAVSDDQTALPLLCSSSVHFELLAASRGDLAGLRRAVQPVYRWLERDPRTRSLIRRIGSLKRQLAVPAAAGPRCARGTGAAALAGTRLDGVYRMQVTAEQSAKHDHVPLAQVNPANYGDLTLVIDRGRFASTQQSKDACTWQYGRVALKGSTMNWSFIDGAPGGNKPGEFFVWRWSLYRDTLSLRTISPTDLPSQTWHRVSSTPLASSLNHRCPPPKRALP